MRFISFFGVVVAAILSVSTQANAQGLSPLPPIIVAPTPFVTGSAIGPDGTYYALVPSSTSTRQTPVTELMAITVAGVSKWKQPATIDGEVGQILAGQNAVYVVQTTTSGSGRSTTITTSLLVFNASTGAAETPLALTGNISDIQIRTIGTDDYLYVVSVSTTSTTSGGTTTTTTMQTLSIYKDGTLVQKVTL